MGALLNTTIVFANASLASLWREYTCERNVSVVPDTVVYSYLQSGAGSLNRKVGYHYSTDSTFVTLIAGTQEYVLNPDTVDVEWIELGGRMLVKSDIERWRSLNIDWRNTAPGTPREWAWYANRIALLPPPDANTVATSPHPVIRYVSHPPDISIYGLEGISDQDRRLVVYRAVEIWSRAYPDSSTSAARAEAFGKFYETGAELVKEQYAARRVLR